MFSNGAEVAWVVPPRLLEVARTDDVGVAARGARVVRRRSVLAPAEAAQASNGGGNPRLGTAFADGAPDGGGRRPRPVRVVVSDDAEPGRRMPRRAGARGRRRASSIERARDDLRRRGRAARRDRGGRSGPIDAVVVALRGRPRARRRSRAGSRCSTSTRGSPSRSATTPRGCGRCPTTPPRPSRPVRVVTRGRRHDRRRSQPGAVRRAAVRGRAPRDRQPGRRVRDQRRGVRRPAGRRDRRAPRVRRRRRRAVGRRARGRRRTGSGCAATRTRRARSRSAVRQSPAGSTTRCASWCVGARRRRRDDAHRSSASSTRTSTSGTRPTPSGTRTSPVSASSTWATSRACAGCSTSRRTSPSRRTGTS